MSSFIESSVKSIFVNLIHFVVRISNISFIEVGASLKKALCSISVSFSIKQLSFKNNVDPENRDDCLLRIGIIKISVIL